MSNTPLLDAVEALRGGTRRQKMEPGQCTYCDKLRADGVSFHPAHDASQNCASGKHSHCSCDTCF